MTGTITLKIDFEGHLNDKMAGFYRSRYSKEGETKYIAVTQFEESDARRAFPCFDHPAKKATFDIEMVVHENLVALSNSPINQEKSLNHGKRLVRFHPTPKMSTYLLFFGLGEFEFIEDRGDVMVRAASLPGMTTHASFGLAFGRKSLDFCEGFFEIKYPLPKLDLIAIPDFAFGAMENWGAITFRENLLLHYPDVTSKAGEQRICEVIAHEIVHQWFGNLVTPSQWKYLWLNESFATYFGYGIVNHYHPEWDIWQQFLHGQTDTAFDRDALHHTFPIEIPGEEHMAINASTAPIIYNKGGSMLRHINGYIGDEGFKRGLKHYLKSHAYACASSHHLWEAFEKVSDKPVTKIMKSWIEQPGFPLVAVEREGDHLHLTQKRFTYLPNEFDQEWLIPVSIRVFYEEGSQKVFPTLLDSASRSIQIGPGVVAYKVNDNQAGFYRVWYADKVNLDELGKGISNKRLSPEDRWGVQNDLYAFVRSGKISLDNYLTFLSNYSDEKAFLPLISMSNNLYHASRIVKGALRARVSSTAKALLERVLGGIGLEPDPKEHQTVSILRDQILFHAVLCGSKDAEEFALEKFESLQRGETIHPDLVKGIMQVGALNGDGSVFQWFDQRLRASESEHERMNILTALGCFRSEEIIETAQQYILDKVPSRNKFFPILAMAANPHAAPLMWDWYRAHLDALEQFHPLHYERVVAGIIPVGGLGREGEVKDFFQDYMSKKQRAREVILLSLERLEINSKMRTAGQLSRT
jgi:tricorn protease interacting factor F2/3